MRGRAANFSGQVSATNGAITALSGAVPPNALRVPRTIPSRAAAAAGGGREAVLRAGRAGRRRGARVAAEPARGRATSQRADPLQVGERGRPGARGAAG